MKYGLIPALVLLAACQPSAPLEADPNLRPVTDAHAPRVAGLLREGLVIVDQREVACDVGPEVACDGFDAVYLGQDGGIDAPGLILFACPLTSAPVDGWKCRRLAKPVLGR